MYSESISILMDLFWKFIDFPLRVRNALRRRIAGMKLFTIDNNVSDSQVTFYEVSVHQIVAHPRRLKRFRRIYDYREILEHVDYKLGKTYLRLAISMNARLIHDINLFKKNDNFGKPRTFRYENLGKISPTTLRYIAVAADIQRIFGEQPLPKIVEVGGGYGGQASVLKKLNYFENYYIYDLPIVQKLIQAYLSKNDVSNVHFPRIEDATNQEYDLFISNYAFSELPRQLQLIYLEKVITKSKRGYMLMNSGRENATGRSDGKISIEELRKFLPHLIVSEEVPLTSPDNYLITWKP
jgi:putative sugar O-methyltransferase